MLQKNKQLPEKGGPHNRKLSRARRHWTTSRLMIIGVKRFFLCVIEARAQSTRDPLQRLLVWIEPMLRRVVKEEVEKGIRRYLSQAPRPIDRNTSPRYRLCFLAELKDFIYTEQCIKDKSGGLIQVSMLDTHSKTVELSPFASASVKIVVLHGNFCTDGRGTWTTDEFEKSIVTRRRGMEEALLDGDVELRLERGVASVCKARFSDISRWAGGGKFRLGVKLVDDVGERVRQGISNPFRVKDRRGKEFEKVDTPSLDDKVWKLTKIAKDSVVHQKLEHDGVDTVGKLLKCFQKDESKLKKILGRTWERTMLHAYKATQGDNVSQAPVALFPDADNMLCTNLLNGVSVGGPDEMVPPINLSSQSYSQFVDIAREQPQTIYYVPGQNETNYPAPPNVGNFYHGSSSSQPDPSDCLREPFHQAQVASLEDDKITAEDLIDNFVDHLLQEPDPAEVDNCRYEEIHDDLSKALTGLLLKCKCIEIVVVAAVKWRRVTKQSAARQAYPAF